MHQSASTVVSALSARSAVGQQYASTVVERYSVQGVRWVTICEHGRERSKCKECGGSQICEHGRVRSSARSAVGHICEHGVTLDARSAVERYRARLCVPVQGVPRGETVVVVVFSIRLDYKQYTDRLGLYFLPGVDLVGGLLRVEVLVSLAALGFAGVDFFAGFFAGVVAFLGVDFLPAFFSATAP